MKKRIEEKIEEFKRMLIEIQQDGYNGCIVIYNKEKTRHLWHEEDNGDSSCMEYVIEALRNHPEYMDKVMEYIVKEKKKKKEKGKEKQRKNIEIDISVISNEEADKMIDRYVKNREREGRIENMQRIVKDKKDGKTNI